MRPKIFFLLILALTGCIIFFDWARNYYFAGIAISPVARIKTIFIIVTSMAIMKFTFTNKGFKLFLILYLGLWLVFFALSFMATHHIFTSRSTEAFSFYRDIMPLESALPLIFFWFVDRMFFIEKKNIR